jgi:hypothetical protein
LEEFYLENPHCCRFYRESQLMNATAMTRVFGVYETVANVHFKANDGSGRAGPYYDSYVRLNACGRVLERMGSFDQVGPTQHGS